MPAEKTRWGLKAAVRVGLYAGRGNRAEDFSDFYRRSGSTLKTALRTNRGDGV